MSDEAPEDDVDEEEMVQICVNVPKSAKETAKQKLDYGGISREVRDRINEIAFGGDLNQRSRLERQRDELKNELREARERRREAEADIESLEERIQAIDEKLAGLTTREEKYEAKLEELESRLREDGVRVDIDHPAVGRAAATGSVEKEGVIKTLKERNPDVPDYAFEDGLHDQHDWGGVDDEGIGKDVDEREEIYR